MRPTAAAQDLPAPKVARREPVRKLSGSMKHAISTLLVVAALTALVFAQDVDTEAAKALQSRIEKLDEKVDDLEAKLKKATEAEKAAVQKEFDAVNANLKDALAEFKDEIAAIKKAGGDASDFQGYYSEISGDYSGLNAGAAVGIVQRWLKRAKTWFIENGPRILISALVFLLILLLFRFMARTAARVTDKTLEKSKLDVSALLRDFFVNVVSKLVFFTGLIIALDYIGIETGPLLAGLGVAGFVIGFALQGTMSNFASGVMILLYRPYDIGEVITAAGVTGSVKAMTLVSTTIKTPDNQTHIVPNNSIWGGVITNVTSQATRRVDLTIGVGYSDDLDKTSQVLTEVVASHELVLKDPAPVIEVAALGASSVDFVVRPWTKTSDYWRVKFDLNKQIKQALDKEGISIPFPQQDVHVVSMPGASAAGE